MHVVCRINVKTRGESVKQIAPELEQVNFGRLHAIAAGSRVDCINAIEQGELDLVLQPIAVLPLSIPCQRALSDRGIVRVGHLLQQSRSYFVRGAVFAQYLVEIDGSMRMHGMYYGLFSHDPVFEVLGYAMHYAARGMNSVQIAVRLREDYARGIEDLYR